MIRKIHANDIDKKKWDERVSTDVDFEVYALSSFLDAVTNNNWEALIEDDYETVMPFMTKVKFGFRYVTMPNFTQKFSLYGDKNRTIDFFSTLRLSIKFVVMNHSLNKNIEFFSIIEIKERSNFVLVLNRAYKDLFSDFSSNHQRNIKKYKNASVETILSQDVKPLLKLCKEELSGVFASDKIEDLLATLISLHELCNEKIRSIIIYANTPEGIIGGAFFLETEHKIYYLMGASKKDMTQYPSALFGLLDYMIEQYASSTRSLDFEGSDLPGIARFFKGFGGINKKYLALKWNDLPFYIKWFKR